MLDDRRQPGDRCGLDGAVGLELQHASERSSGSNERTRDHHHPKLVTSRSLMPNDAFIAGSCPAHRQAYMAAPGEVDARLAEIARDASAAWPQLPPPTDAFFRHLASVLPPSDELLLALSRVRAGDLLLAHACLQEDPRAIRELEETCFAELPRALHKVVGPDVPLDDVLQRVRVRVLLGSERTPPALQGYGGRGPLGGWLRVTATRVAIDNTRVRARDRLRTADADALERLPDTPQAPNADARYRRHFEAALESVLSELPPRERTILRQVVVLGMSARSLARAYDVHHTTVARWIRDTHATVAQRTRERLRSELGVAERTLDSIIAGSGPDLELTLSRILRDDVS